MGGYGEEKGGKKDSHAFILSFLERRRTDKNKWSGSFGVNKTEARRVETESLRSGAARGWGVEVVAEDRVAKRE